MKAIDVAQWKHACLACIIPWVQSLTQGTKIDERKIKIIKGQGVAQVVECMPSSIEAISSYSILPKIINSQTRGKCLQEYSW
jgi:hypothetical protein